LRLPGVFKLSEFAHVTDFDRHFHAEPAWSDADGQPLYRVLQIVRRHVVADPPTIEGSR
jgi:hypothetical protein